VTELLREGVEKVWYGVPVSIEALEDAPIIGEHIRRMELATRGFGPVRCHRCHRWVRCVYTAFLWGLPLYYGRACFETVGREVVARLGELYRP
jgi:hypothetical protein